ncbi:WavE lipopolysaccharide synthesis family protein [Citrobacter sp. FP75]|uniref:WavE lipopolysaccharide synthesis family protein n=1 Tax=Citrobacter sp. FP75 TaxID=1852949 RepID=UPI001BC97AED|nr:WavE lipopolysaccharide synthesis family protein [Citrobacter sp. FP75]
MDSLSIIFQGPTRESGIISADAWKCIKRTRTLFPKAELIVSTWYDSPESDRQLQEHLAEIQGQLVLSDDPGPLRVQHEGYEHLINVNRLRVSASQGLAKASRPYAIKLRTDTWLYSRRLIGMLKRHVQHSDALNRDERFTVFRSRVINANFFARDARGSLPYLFHPGDILLAGRTEDVRAYFAAPPATEDLFSPCAIPGIWCAWRFVAEQYFWVNAIIQQHGQCAFAGNTHRSAELVALSEQYYLANFLPYSFRQLGLRWPKYWQRYPLRGLFSVYTQRRWFQLYWRYQGQPKNPGVIGYLDKVFTMLWKTGYCLRHRLLRRPSIRNLVINLFSYRR